MKKITLILIAIMGFTFLTTNVKSKSISPISFSDKHSLTDNYSTASLSSFDKAFALDNNSPDKKRKKKKAFGEGAMVMSLGYGIPNVYKWAFTTYELLYPDGKAAGIGPIHAKFEYGLADKFGIGLVIDFATASFIWSEEGFTDPSKTYDSGFKGNGLAFSLRGNWHFYSTKTLDLYSGVHFGYDLGAMKFFSDDPDIMTFLPDVSFPFVLGGTIGMRYFFTKNIGAYMELGYAKSLAQFGVCYKL